MAEITGLEPIARQLSPLLDSPAGPEHVVHLALAAGFLVGRGMAPEAAWLTLRQAEAQGLFPLAALAARGVFWNIPGPVAGAPWYYGARGPAALPRPELGGILS